ncbi:MAG: hypothetical protein F9K40_09790 [Kofleriaceae bacterium]|nr:MAG: hypothetical protein F9K40_09790 [Kofleriaceae bacterium]MBZ0235481.1 hypothetical protein [Kofleriaceae bacterium]
MELADELVATIGELLGRGAALTEYLPVLRQFRDRGLSASAAYAALERMRVGADEPTEDRILDLLDIASGYCGPGLRVWTP